MMQMRALTYNFFSFFIFLLAATFILVSLADPYRVLNQTWQLETKSHLNFYKMKLDLLKEAKDVQALILGSSTSENYLTNQVEKQMGLKAFHGSVAGSQTAGRMAIAHYALQNIPSLKKIVYNADFYEFNRNQRDFFDPLVYDSKEIQPYIPKLAKQARSFDLEQKIWQIYSHVAIEKSFKQLQWYFSNGGPTVYSPVGDKIESAQTPPVAVTENFVQELKLEAANEDLSKINAKLMNGIGESLMEYKQGALKNFAHSALSEQLYLELCKKAAEKGVDVFFILSPYHPVFRTQVLDTEKAQAQYQKWRQFIKSLAVMDNVHVLDALASEKFFPSSIKFWRDGVHYSHQAAAVLLSLEN